MWGVYPPLLYPGIDIGFGWYPGIDLGLYFGGWGGWGWGAGDGRPTGSAAIFSSTTPSSTVTASGISREAIDWAVQRGRIIPNTGSACRTPIARWRTGMRAMALSAAAFRTQSNRGEAVPQQRFGNPGFEQRGFTANHSVFGGYQNGGMSRMQSDRGFSSMGAGRTFGGGGFGGGGFGGGGARGGGRR